MELRRFAEAVLGADRLEDKLVSLGEPEDRDPGRARAVPIAPGRPRELPLRDGRAKVAVPAALDRDEDRRRVLHAFAVHELLALELLALALLRFPDADPRLRRAWALTAVDEQRHLGRYIERLAACGGHLGEVPGSAFFWDALAHSPDPATFTIGLSLVLEQANLDFARVWRRRFASAGDADTANVLAEVYADEIRHVRIGATTLQAIRRSGESEFDAFARSVVFPLTPARARGPEPDREARLAAGLSAEFVDRLLVWGMSKGRDPKVFLFDPHVEDSVAGRPIATPSPVEDDLSALPVWLAGADDVVIGRRPRTEYLLELSQLGVAIPQFVARAAPELLPNGRAGALLPWGWSPRTAHRLAPIGGRWDPAIAPVYSKAWAAEIARECPVPTDPGHLGVVCRAVDEVEAQLDGRSFWLKAALSTAGTHRLRVDRLDDRARTWLARTFALGPVVVEADLDVVAELSVQVDVGDDVRVVGITRFWAERGVYRGTVVGRADLGCSPEILRFLNSPRPGAIFAALRDAGRFVGERAAALGFRGALGVDALIVRADGGLALKPISEVNARWTMGRVALALGERLAPGSVGAWVFARAGAVPPDRRTAMEVVEGRWRAGILATTDPVPARRLTTWLVVDRSWADVLARANALGLASGEQTARRERCIQSPRPEDR